MRHPEAEAVARALTVAAGDGRPLVATEAPREVEIGRPRDKYAVSEPPPIDCAERLPLCNARCCTLTFALTPQDLEEGVVRWDRERPYRIARVGGACAHLARGRCGIYAQRPAACRAFDCRRDSRIWIDFERRIPAP